MPTRSDGRNADDARSLSIKYERLARVDGSASFAFGETAALASLSGPIEVRLANELPSKATFEVLVRPLSNVSATESKSLAASLRSCLEPSLILTKNPRTLVQLVVQSLSSPRSPNGRYPLSAAMVNASSLALLNASSVPMCGVVTAAAVGRVAKGSLILDPSDEESRNLHAAGYFAFMFSGEGNIDCVSSSWTATAGGYDESELYSARELARKGAREVYEAIRKSISGGTEASVLSSRPKTESTDKMYEETGGTRLKSEEDDDDKMEI